MATKSIAWDSGGGYIRLTYTGSGNGPISVESDVNNLGTARSKTVTIETTKGGLVTKNVTVSQAACPVPVGTVLDYSYTGSYQEVLLPAGSYKLQCWGAQGGSNAADPTYGITAQAGGKGGYSEGVLTLSQNTKIRIYVGGKGTSSAGGFNGGGATSGSSSYDSSDIFGITKKGGGGGATDIRLSDGSLYSRMIVAGGGSGGVMAYKRVTTSTTQTHTESFFTSAGGWINSSNKWEQDAPARYYGAIISGSSYRGSIFTVDTQNVIYIAFLKSQPTTKNESINYCSGTTRYTVNNTSRYTVPSDCNYVYVELCRGGSMLGLQSVTFTWTETSATETRQSQVGYAGGGTSSLAGYSAYAATQNAAGSGGSFCDGSTSNHTNYRYSSAGAGGGWYGGGSYGANNSNISIINYSGGGSGFVNTAASAGNRPSGYTGLQLDSGETKAGNTSFPSTSGGTETGHSGNGYARITRIA